MRLLVVTQAVDLESEVLGFFHSGLVKLAEHFDSVIAIALSQGRAQLPENVAVRSLGKELGYSRPRSVVRFFEYIWSERRNYDVVLVHMTPVFLLMGWPLWKLQRKRILLWYNHRKGGVGAWLAAVGADVVFFTSDFSYSSRFANAKKMPAGVCTDQFDQQGRKRPQASLLYLGRISPVKNVDCLIEAAKILDREGHRFVLALVGSPVVPSDRAYERQLRDSARELVAAGKALFSPGVPNYDAPRVFNENAIFVNLTPSGSFDKTVLEAMACESLVLVCNRSFGDALPAPFVFAEGDPVDLAKKLRFLLRLSDEDRKEYGRGFRRYVVEHHGVDRLVEEIRGAL